MSCADPNKKLLLEGGARVDVNVRFSCMPVRNDGLASYFKIQRTLFVEVVLLLKYDRQQPSWFWKSVIHPSQKIQILVALSQEEEPNMCLQDTASNATDSASNLN